MDSLIYSDQVYRMFGLSPRLDHQSDAGKAQIGTMAPDIGQDVSRIQESTLELDPFTDGGLWDQVPLEDNAAGLPIQIHSDQRLEGSFPGFEAFSPKP